MKDIILAFLSAISGSLITFCLTVNHYSKKIYKKNVMQRIFSLINFGNNTYNDDKKIKEIVDEKTKNKPDIIVSESEPESDEQKPGDYWIQDY